MSWAAMAKTRFQDTFLPCCLIVLVFLQPLPSIVYGNVKADFSVVGPNDPILAIMGKDTELPCHLYPNISIEDMELRWYRDQPSPAVYVYEKGKDTYKEQMEEYRGRTTFVGDDVAKGKAAVRIHNVTTFDNGTYHCHFRDDRAFSEATLWLKVAGLGADPGIRMRDDKDKGIQAECTSAGWYPEPQVMWTDYRGNTIPSESSVSASPTSGLFAVASRVTIRDRAVESLRCSISNPLLPERKVAEIHLPDSFSRRSQFTVWKIVLPLMLIVLGLVIAGVICVFWKRQKEKNRRLLEDERESSRQHDSSAWDQPPDEQLQEELSWRKSSPIYGYRKAVLYAVSPSLDPDTANSTLILSEDRKSMRRLLFEQDLPDSSERFDKDPCVLGWERFTSGKHYWEVEVGNRQAWNLGICLESLGRKGRIPKSPGHGVWAVEFYKKKYWALTYPRKLLHPSEPLHRVGIFLDCDAGNITFYNMTNESHIYTFSGIFFSGPLQPFFCLWTHDSHPLTICQVSGDREEMTTPQNGSELSPGLSVTPIRETPASFSRDRDPPQTRPLFFSPQFSPELWEKHPIS